MQTAAIARSVFIKTTKKATMAAAKVDIHAFAKELYHMAWVKEDATGSTSHHHEEYLDF
jgi:hypothetical protein